MRMKPKLSQRRAPLTTSPCSATSTNSSRPPAKIGTAQCINWVGVRRATSHMASNPTAILMSCALNRDGVSMVAL